MTITAYYIDTCFSDYLRDSHSREGETLCLAGLGCDLDTTIEALVASVDCDAGIPDALSNADLARAMRSALEGVDLRYIDEDGTRQEEPDEDRDSEEPYIYVFLQWE